MADPEFHSDLPEIAAHPELLEIMRLVGRKLISADEGYEKIRDIIANYLPQPASMRQGELIAFTMIVKLFPASSIPTASVGAARPSRGWDESKRLEGILAGWERARTEPSSPLAADRGARGLISDVYLFAGQDPDIAEAFKILSTEKLRVIFPEPAIIR